MAALVRDIPKRLLVADSPAEGPEADHIGAMVDVVYVQSLWRSKYSGETLGELKPSVGRLLTGLSLLPMRLWPA